MYSFDSEWVLSGFSKAYTSALSNYDAAVALADQNHHAQATSIAILALEEVGKMVLLDGLLFARTGDERYKRYKKGHLLHRTKLDAIKLFPLFLFYLTSVDPRRDEDRFKQTMAIVFADWEAKRQKLADLLGENFAFSGLDTLKQQGFYSHETDGTVKANNEAIDPEVSRAILELTWRVTDSLRFVLGQSLEHYKDFFREVREKVDDASLKRTRNYATKIVKGLFGLEEDREGGAAA
ncbi:MAG: AbiV family abortive infection protein [Chloroflexi bacterium]|nr:AbiV family abortive infection protein [Chloroflexota bacterium]